MDYKLKKFKKDLEITRIANIHYFEFTNRYHTQVDTHAFRELIYVDTKAIEVHSEQYTGPMCKNQMIIHREMEPHALRCPDNEAPNVIIIGFECHCPELDPLCGRPIFLSLDQQRLLSEIVREGRAVFLPPYDQPQLKDMKKNPNPPFGADQMLKSKLELLLIELIRTGNAQPQRSPSQPNEAKIMDVVDFLQANYRNDLRLDELCSLFKTNKTTLCNQFKQLQGTTVVDFVNRLKIRDAKQLLREGKLNITQISQQLGFSSIHYFSRIFKKYTNLSPSEYTRTIKAKFD